jgi:hypothetical protein
MLDKLPRGATFLYMPRPERQHPQRRYHGENFGSEVVTFLNNFPGVAHKIDFGPGQKRMLSLLARLRPIVFGKPIYLRGDPRLKNTFPANRILSRYKTCSLVGPADDFSDGTTAKPFSICFINVTSANRAAASYECNAAYALMRLAELNSLDSLRTCRQCGLWFFAKFAHQQFCRKECRIKHNSSSDEWKEYKRNKARQYYQLHKSGKVRER